MDKLVSVILPIYNVEKYLRKCIDSVINQTYVNTEIILVDDGSTDNSGLICDDFKAIDSRVKLIHKTNGGLASARNAGLEIAQGDYISFIDSDDYIDKFFLSKMVDALERTKSQIATCGRIMVDEKNKVIGSLFIEDKEVVYDRKTIISKLLLWDDIDSSVCDKLFCKTIFDDIRFPLGVMSEDYDAAIRLLLNTDQVVHVGVPLYCYRQREGSITKEGFTPKRLSSLMQSYKLRDTVLKEYPELKEKCSYFVGSHIIMTQRFAKNATNGYVEELKILLEKSKLERKNIVFCHYFPLKERIKYLARDIYLWTQLLMMKRGV